LKGQRVTNNNNNSSRTRAVQTEMLKNRMMNIVGQ